MDKVKQFREYTRQLECHLGNMNQSDCCCCGISEGQCFLIVEIGRKPGVSVKELAEILHIDKSGVSRSVEELVQKGFVERKPAIEDRRFVRLHLLPKGQERFEKIEHDMYLKFKEVFEQIPVEKQEQVIEALQLYNEACLKVEENKGEERNDKKG
ncbi:MAG: MarR family transcriptional regulator [Lachnospiraceae bacterium]|nr:MarR family transcriptional regulator [Lachnospiraceae bacterium]